MSPNIIPDVQISVIPQGPVCDGDSLTFNTVFSSSGLTPTFIWRVNGIPIGVTTNFYSSTTLQNNDVIDVILTSSAFCALPLTDTSNRIVAVL